MRRFGDAVLSWLAALAAAFQFLTRFPLAVRMTPADVHFRRSVVFFPAAGLAVGAVTAGIAWALAQVAPPSVAGILAVAVWTLVTGALHLDGLMDTADGLFSHRPRERMLEIMKDSRSGPMGVMACVLDLLLKAACLIYLAEMDVRMAWLLLALVPVWSRAFMACAIVRWPYARKEAGLGALFRSARGRHAWAAWAVAMLITVPAVFSQTGTGAAKWGLALGFCLLAYGIGAALASAINRKLGGLTGDVYGALNEADEIVLLLGIVICLHNGVFVA